MEDATALGKMAGDADASGFFSADEDLALQHEIADVLEANAALVQLASVTGSDAGEHACGVEGAHDFSRPLPALQQPAQQHGVNLVRIHEAAVFGDGADAVGVAIGNKTGVTLFADHRLLQHLHMRLDRLRIDSRKQWIDLAANLQKLDAALAEYAGQHTAPGAIHRVNSEFET